MLSCVESCRVQPFVLFPAKTQCSGLFVFLFAPFRLSTVTTWEHVSQCGARVDLLIPIDFNFSTQFPANFPRESFFLDFMMRHDDEAQGHQDTPTAMCQPCSPPSACRCSVTAAFSSNPACSPLPNPCPLEPQQLEATITTNTTNSPPITCRLYPRDRLPPRPSGLGCPPATATPHILLPRLSLVSPSQRSSPHAGRYHQPFQPWSGFLFFCPDAPLGMTMRLCQAQPILLHTAQHLHARVSLQLDPIEPPTFRASVSTPTTHDDSLSQYFSFKNDTIIFLQGSVNFRV